MLRKQLVGLLLGVLALTSLRAQAATLTVRQDGAGGAYTTIQSALYAANTGDTVQVADLGTYDEMIWMFKGVTLESVPAGATLKNWVASDYYITAPITIRNFIFDTANTEPPGSCICIFSSNTVTIENINILASNDGGITAVSRGVNLIVRNCILNQIKNNAILLNDEAGDQRLLVENCLINHVAQANGILAINQCDVTVNRCLIMNVAGSAIATNATTTCTTPLNLAVNNCDINSCTIGLRLMGNRGGATVNNTRIHDLVAPAVGANGSAIFSNHPSTLNITLNHCDIYNTTNNAVRNNAWNHLTFNSTRFANCGKPSVEGGGATNATLFCGFSCTGASLAMTDCEVTSGGNVGILLSRDTTATLQNCLIQGNGHDGLRRDGERGGNVDVPFGPSKITIAKTIFRGNRAKGVFIRANTSDQYTTVSDSLFQGNSDSAFACDLNGTKPGRNRVVLLNNQFQDGSGNASSAVRVQRTLAGSRIVNNLIQQGAVGLELGAGAVANVHHNTIVNKNAPNSTGLVLNDTQAGPVDLQNNIIEQVANGIVALGSNDAYNIDYNLVNASVLAVGVGVNTGARNIVGRPAQFKQPSLTGFSGDYHLRKTSPALNVGNPAVVVASDLDGAARSDGKPDMGAFELFIPANAAQAWLYYQ